MMREGRLAPDSFINPSLPLYLMAIPILVQARLAEAGVLSGLAADPLVAGRGLSAFAGALAVLVLGLAARRHAPGLGAGPALLLAVAPGVVNLCHFATPEPWLLLGMAAVLWLTLAHARGTAPAWALGLVLGLTASTKYTAAAAIVPALLAVAARARSDCGRRDRIAVAGLAAVALVLGVALVGAPGTALGAALHLPDARLLKPASALRFVRGLGVLAVAGGLAGLAVVALAGRVGAFARLCRVEVVSLALAAASGFLAGTPFAAVRPLAFLSDLAYDDQTRREYKGLVGEDTSFGAYVGLAGDALTPPLLAAALAGLLLGARDAARRGSLVPALPGLLALCPYLLIAASGHRAMRFLAPAWPAAAWLAAAALHALPEARWRRIGTLALTLRALGASLLVVRLFFVDARILASRWLAAHVPPGTTVDLIANHPGYAPTAPEGLALRVVPTLSREMAPLERFREAAARYPAEAAPWLVLTASFYERFLDHPDQQPERARFFRDLLEGRGGFEVAARHRQRGWLRPPNEFLDPEIVILRRAR
jgi:hypothetical protein